MQFFLTFLSLALAFRTASAAAVSSRALPGFVQTNGTRFSLDGQKYTVVGANAYWISLAGLSNKDLDKSFSDIASMGATSVRVWGHNEMSEQYIYPAGIVYQIWSGNKAKVNYGENGLGYFDRVIASARKHNLRLIVALTSNYNQDYITGGINTYIKQVLGRDEFHEVFFTNSEIKSAYKSYVTAVVERYKEEATILSWELGHHLKCSVSWHPYNPKCSTEAITSWIQEMSSHIKTIDPNHLVAVGDEGFYNREGNSRWIYNGRDGIDFEANIALKSIDYGTFAYRPESYELRNTEEPLQWIEEHGKSQARAGKPVVLADIGLEIRESWLDKVVSSGIAGTLYWQAGSDGISLNMPFWFHGDSISTASTAYVNLRKHAEALKKQ
ncbi:CEL4b mannanase [Coprinopsis marcescibilis]|uniref:mannan endo-1,4-beta-mannosidase n=1 Tax=Coprinopsis marcescibilis TaxID=230819 RepID=A0A5C3KL54_COPMA|nr:CEL4b mannanase [Coprinopsis marcescibilis]